MVEPPESVEARGAGALLTESDYESNKIFAGGLCRTTTCADLKRYFGQFGEVTETEIVMDRLTGRSRGFGFVSFASRDAVRAVLRRDHSVDGVPVEVKLAVKKEKSKVLAPKYDETKRIFVGGVADRITEDYFRDYFVRYGPISSYNYLYDRRTNRPRGYGFVIYEKSADALKSVGKHPSLGPNCEAKFAQLKAETSAPEPEPAPSFDYSAYYYAQANLLYSQYLSQIYNGYSKMVGGSDDRLNVEDDEDDEDERGNEDEDEDERFEEEKERKRRRLDSARRSRASSRSEGAKHRDERDRLRDEPGTPRDDPDRRAIARVRLRREEEVEHAREGDLGEPTSSARDYGDYRSHFDQRIHPDRRARPREEDYDPYRDGRGGARYPPDPRAGGRYDPEPVSSRYAPESRGDRYAPEGRGPSRYDPAPTRYQGPSSRYEGPNSRYEGTASRYDSSGRYEPAPRHDRDGVGRYYRDGRERVYDRDEPGREDYRLRREPEWGRERDRRERLDPRELYDPRSRRSRSRSPRALDRRSHSRSRRFRR